MTAAHPPTVGAAAGAARGTGSVRRRRRARTVAGKRATLEALEDPVGAAQTVSYLGLGSAVRTFLRAANRPNVLPSEVAASGSVGDLLDELRTGVLVECFEEVALDPETLRAQVAAWHERQGRFVAGLVQWLNRRAGANPV